MYMLPSLELQRRKRFRFPLGPQTLSYSAPPVLPAAEQAPTLNQTPETQFYQALGSGRQMRRIAGQAGRMNRLTARATGEPTPIEQVRARKRSRMEGRWEQGRLRRFGAPPASMAQTAERGPGQAPQLAPSTQVTPMQLLAGRLGAQPGITPLERATQEAQIAVQNAEAALATARPGIEAEKATLDIQTAQQNLAQVQAAHEQEMRERGQAADIGASQEQREEQRFGREMKAPYLPTIEAQTGILSAMPEGQRGIYAPYLMGQVGGQTGMAPELTAQAEQQQRDLQLGTDFKALDMRVNISGLSQMTGNLFGVEGATDVIDDIAGEIGAPGWLGMYRSEDLSKVLGFANSLEATMSQLSDTQKDMLISKLKSHPKWSQFMNKIRSWSSENPPGTIDLVENRWTSNDYPMARQAYEIISSLMGE